MIDYVSLYTNIEIPSKEFSTLKWNVYENERGEYYQRTINSVLIRYFHNTHRLDIRGKLVLLLHDTRVLNVDDIYGSDAEKFLDEVNRKISGLFQTVKIDVRSFITSRIDYCFNVKTPFVEAYISFLDRAFKAVNNGHRTNFCEERGEDGSVYIKPTGEYKANARKSYTLNFYNKLDWLEKQQGQGQRFNERDIQCAGDVLRLEVQCSFTRIQRVSESRKFGDLYSFKTALTEISKVYRLVFKGDDEQRFYKYKTAKNLLPKSKAREVLELSAEGHVVTDSRYRYAVQKIKDAGIYPYYFLPTKFCMDTLPNPIELIEMKLKNLEVI